MPSLAENQARFRQHCQVLFSEEAHPGLQRQAAHDLFELFSEIIGYDDNTADGSLRQDSLLPGGKAISFQGAARCLWEYRRTHKFLIGVESAVVEARKRFPGERVRLMEAGSGPFAMLALPMALHFPPEQLSIVAADIHGESLTALRTLVKGLGLDDYLEDCIQADLAEWQCPDTLRPHVIVSETMLNGLRSEPQVAITRNLAPQLSSGGLFLPEAIILEFGHYLSSDPESDRAPGFAPFAPLYELRPDREAEKDAGRIQLKMVGECKGQAAINTRIIVFGDSELGLNDSSLNLPLMVRGLPPLRDGMELDYRYVCNPKPAWEFSVVA